MKKIILLGELGRKFGRSHKLDIKTTGEAIRALCANFKDFRSYLINSDKNGAGYKIILGKSGIKKDEECFYPLSMKETITIVPVISGADSGEAKIFAGIAIIAIGTILTVGAGGAFLASVAPYIVGIGVATTLGGVSQLLTPIPRGPKSIDTEDNGRVSYAFNGAINTSTQGFPVPVGYGRLIVGSAVISAGITVEDIPA